MNVVVTGGAPYAVGCDYNTSAMIRDALPDSIQRTGAPVIRIWKCAVDVESTYSFVKDFIPKIWSVDQTMMNSNESDEKLKRIDIMLHLGMRRRENCFCLEKQARRDVYTKPGVDGKYLPSEDIGAGGVWRDLPEVLKPGFDIEEAAKKVSKQLPHIPIRASDDAGMFFCEFQLFSSLGLLAKRRDFARAVFLHTPPGSEDEDIQNGVEIITALVSALLDDASFVEAR